MEVIWGANVTNSLLRGGEGEFSSLAIKVGDTHVDIFVGCLHILGFHSLNTYIRQ